MMMILMQCFTVHCNICKVCSGHKISGVIIPRQVTEGTTLQKIDLHFNFVSTGLFVGFISVLWDWQCIRVIACRGGCTGLQCTHCTGANIVLYCRRVHCNIPVHTLNVLWRVHCNVSVRELYCIVLRGVHCTALGNMVLYAACEVWRWKTNLHCCICICVCVCFVFSCGAMFIT